MNRSWLRAWTPPAVLRIINRLRHGESGLSGIYPNWEVATRNAGRYDDTKIFDRVVAATDKARESGGKLFERDSVLFDHPVTPFPLLSCLLSVAARNKRGLTVVDFGGSLGSTYRQCASFLSHIRPLRWKVVEQEHVAEAGRKRFSSDILSFHDTLPDASKGEAIDVIVLSGVLQYLEDPYSILAQVRELMPTAILIDRTPVSACAEDVFSIQIVPPTIFAARLPFRAFGAGKLGAAFKDDYNQVAVFPTADPDMIAGPVKVRFRGKWFERT
jgi:putative methyltransferase (TIGR04325 family)